MSRAICFFGRFFGHLFGISVIAVTLTACGASPSDPAAAGPGDVARVVRQLGAVAGVTRDQLVDDVYHYSFVVRVGTSANARLRLHRVVREEAPWQPRATAAGAMLLHGDFSTFVTSFAPRLGSPPSSETGLGAYLAARDIDVWGFDRRWAQAPTDADLGDFADMGVAQELDDIGAALALARAVRVATGAGDDRLTLIGFSHGGQLAYTYAAVEGGRPAAQRHVRALVPLDVYAAIAPEDEPLRLAACMNRDVERQLLAAGVTDSDNGFFITAGTLALDAPNEPSPLFPGSSNRETVDAIVAETYQFFAPTPVYHLAAGRYEGGALAGLRESPERVIDAWFAGATPHQSLREVAELDALWCGEAPLPVSAPLSQIRVPLLYVGAAGGFGDHGRYTTTRVSSTDVTTMVVRRFAPEREAEDFGHGDLLFASDAPTLVWQPLAAWILGH